jgi:hypothetical protein
VILFFIVSTLNDELCTTVTRPLLKIIETSVTPSNAETALVTSFTQLTQDIPSIVNTVVMVVGGVVVVGRVVVVAGVVVVVGRVVVVAGVVVVVGRVVVVAGVVVVVGRVVVVAGVVVVTQVGVGVLSADVVMFSLEVSEVCSVISS